MERGLKQMLWMSWALRYRTCLNYAEPNRVSRSIAQNYWTNSRDIYWSEKLEPLKKIVENSQTNSTKDFLHTLNNINSKRLNMDLKDTLNVLTALAKLTREDRCKIDVMHYEGFQALCEQLKKQIRLMTLNEVIDSIKLLTFLNVPASTVLMQNLLQIVRNSINDLQIHQVHILLCLLKKMENTSLSSALCIALPILLPNIINTKLNYNDLHELSIALFRIKFEGEKYTIIKICKSIEALLRESPRTASVNTIKNIFTSLCHIPVSKYDSNVLPNTLELVKERLFHKASRLFPVEILDCIDATSHSVANGNMLPYSSSFVNTLLEVTITKDVDLNTGYRIQKHLNKMQYVYVPFLEHLLNKTLSDETPGNNLHVLLNAFCISGYKSIPWTYIENNILQTSFLNDTSTKNLLQYGLYLAALDKYYIQILSTVFMKTHVTTLMSLGNSYFNCARLLCLYQSVKTLCPEYKGPWPSEETLTYVYNMTYFPKRSVLKNHLQIAMGGPQYVLTNLRTKIGHTIDCAIIMRKGGYPIAFNTDNSEVLANYNCYVEELQCPPESYVILILEFPRNAYSINTSRLLDVKRLQLRTLEKWTGHKCIDINLDIWENLPKHEKNSHVMQKIRNECNDIIPEM